MIEKSELKEQYLNELTDGVHHEDIIDDIARPLEGAGYETKEDFNRVDVFRTLAKGKQHIGSIEIDAQDRVCFNLTRQKAAVRDLVTPEITK